MVMVASDISMYVELVSTMCLEFPEAVFVLSAEKKYKLRESVVCELMDVWMLLHCRQGFFIFPP